MNCEPLSIFGYFAIAHVVGMCVSFIAMCWHDRDVFWDRDSLVNAVLLAVAGGYGGALTVVCLAAVEKFRAARAE